MADTDTKTAQTAPFYLIGIGASAGGLEPLEELFRTLPADTGAAFVVVQHLSPDHKSMMRDLLARHTTMPVHQVEDHMQVRPNSVYLIPPGKNLTLEGHELRLVAREAPKRLHPNFPIDVFLQSVAKSVGEWAVGVVLSGTGSDGTRGVREINEAGGLVVVQDPDTAQFDGMPRSAILTGLADHVLSPQEIAQVLGDYTSHPPGYLATTPQAPSAGLLDAETLKRIVDILARDREVDFSHYKPTTLSRRIERRCLIAGHGALDQYIHRLEESEEERAALRSDMLISVTGFFRDPEAWTFLEREVMPGIIERASKGQQLGLWVAACATGEEAYSLAMLSQEAMEAAGKSLEVKIFATDLDEAALERANAGLYPDSITDDVSPERLQRFFVRRQGQYQVAPSLRKSIIFAPHNLIQDAPFTHMHMVTCRNMLIYLQPELQRQVIGTLHFALDVEGVLFLGASEAVTGLDGEFRTRHPKWKVFEKIRDVRLPATTRLRPPRAPIRRDEPAAAVADTLLTQGFEGLLGERKAVCLFVGENNELLHAFGQPEAFLHVPVGKASLAATDMMPHELSLPLSTALLRAKRDRERIAYSGVRLGEGDAERIVDLRVTHHPATRHRQQFSVVVVEDTDKPAAAHVAEQFDPDSQAAHRLAELENELQRTRENLQATIEELETTNEEQQATNEELLASNEELQSTNEELHSVNEELHTVNAEYQAKIAELAQLTQDMDNLLSSTGIGTLFLDRELKIRKYTPAVAEVMRVVEHDVGRPIVDLSHRLEYESLQPDLEQVLASGEHLERDVATQRGKSMLMGIHPYRSDGGPPSGVVVTFVEVTELKAIQRELEKTKDGLAQRTDELAAANTRLRQEAEQRERVQAELRHHNAALQGVREVFETGLHSDTEEELGKACLSVAEQLTGSAFGFIGEVNAEGRFDTLALSNPGWEACQIPDSEAAVLIRGMELRGLWGDVLQQGRSLIANDPLAHPQSVGLPAGHPPLTSFLGVPLLEEGEVLGMIAVANREGGYDASHQAALESVASAFATALARKRAETALRKAKETLEARVQERTEGLSAANEELRVEVEERVQTEERLRASEARYRTLVTHLPQKVFVKDRDLRYVSCNELYANDHGLTAAEMEGKTDLDLYPEELARKYQEDDARVMESGELEAFDEQYQFGEETQTVHMLKTPVRAIDGEVTGVLGVFWDVTQERRTEEALRAAREAAEAASRAKSDFVANMSHEIRTPLNGVVGLVDLALGTELTRRQREFLTLARQSADALNAVVSDVLDFSKIEADRLDLDEAPFALRDTVESTLAALGVRVYDKHVELVSRIAPDVPDSLVGDAIRLRQVLINLVGNALKFTERGEVAVEVRLADDEQPQADGDSALENVALHFTVRDTGIGIPADQLADIFDAFTQVDTSSTRRFGGSGLGLAISSRLAVAMGGRLWAESDEGVGSTFHFTVRCPLAPAPVQETAPPAELAGVRVLVAEGNETCRLSLCETLAGWGMEPVAAADAESALSAAAQGPFAMALLTEPLSEDELKALRVALGEAETVLVSSPGRLPQIEQVAGEFAAHLLKPIQQSELLAVVCSSLGLAAEPVVAPEGAADYETRPLRVLVVEDNEVNRLVVTEMLELAGHTVRTAVDGRDALSVLAVRDVDVVLMDLQMPRLDGLSATQQIRNLESNVRNHQVPIIAMTAHAMASDRDRCLAAGMDGYVVKPLKEEDLWAELSRVIPGVAAPASPACVFDPESTLNRAHGKPEVVARMIEAFQRDATQLLCDAEAALDNEDLPAVARAAHTLKGMVGNFGAAPAQAAALDLEKCAKSNDEAAVRTAFATARQEVDLLSRALKTCS